MNSNFSKDKSLYLKEFFGHYFDRKSMLETISSFKMGLDVLETILTKFQNKLDIEIPRKNKNNHQSILTQSDI